MVDLVEYATRHSGFHRFFCFCFYLFKDVRFWLLKYTALHEGRLEDAVSTKAYTYAILYYFHLQFTAYTTTKSLENYKCPGQLPN